MHLMVVLSLSRDTIVTALFALEAWIDYSKTF